MKNKKQQVNFKILWHVLFALLLACIVTFGLLYIFAFVVTKQAFSQNSFIFFSLLAMSLGSFTGGDVLARLQKKNGLLFGSLVGVIFVVVTLASHYNSGFVLTTPILVRMLLLLLSGSIGGYIGIMRVEKKKKHTY